MGEKDYLGGGEEPSRRGDSKFDGKASKRKKGHLPKRGSLKKVNLADEQNCAKLGPRPLEYTQ